MANAKFKDILKQIKKYNRIIIHGHIRPDGDCVGSQFGLQKLIQTNFPEKEVYVDGDVCEYCSFLGEPIRVPDEYYKGALSIVVDCGNAERISDQRYKDGDYLIKIDHHIPDTQYGDIYYVEEEAASCTQIIVDFARKCKLRLTKEAAYPLYVGLVTDSGRFRFDSVTPHTFENAAILLSTGIDIADVDNKLSVTTLETLKLNGLNSSILLIPTCDKSGVLYNMLKIFNDYNINLNAIMSRPTKEGLGKYYFYAEFRYSEDNVGNILNVFEEKNLKNDFKIKQLGFYSREGDE